jgi:hypothetical protein
MGALVIAQCESSAGTRLDIQESLMQFYGLTSSSQPLFNTWFDPCVQLAYAREPREFGYLQHLEAAINDPRQSLLPTILEPAEQLQLL